MAEYREGIYVGYRYYDKKKIPVLFPFGHGLSYTEFEYSNLKLSADAVKESDKLTVSVDIKNVGEVTGKAVAQIYVKNLENPKTDRVVRELKGFEKVELNPGETKTVTVTLDSRAFAYWNTELHDWFVESGEYGIEVGASSRDIRQSKSVSVTGEKSIPLFVTDNTPYGDIEHQPGVDKIMEPILAGYLFGQDEGESAAEAISPEMQAAMFAEMPLRNLLGFSDGSITSDDLNKAIDEMNKLGLVKK